MKPPALHPRAGLLLVATPALVDPNFERTVILLLDLDEEGVLGVVLNRPSPVEVATILPGWADAASAPAVLFQGGPVSMESALAVALRDPAVAELPDGFREIDERFAIVDLEEEYDGVGAGFVAVRVFAGYAGWSTVQLEAEIDEGSWFVVEAEPGDLGTDNPSGMWQQVLRRQRNELAWVSLMPEDPTMN
jgi:putative transcriptional regulator